MQKFNEMPYERPNIEEIKNLFNSQLNRFKEASDLETQIGCITQINQINKDVETLSSLVYIRSSIDTTDYFYEKEKSFFDTIGPEIEDLNFSYYKALISSSFKEALKEHFGKQLFTIAEFKVKSFDKKILEDLKEENKLRSEYSKLMASAKINFDGKELNLSELTPYMQSIDREVRKKASFAKFYFIKNNQKQFDDIFDKLVKLRTSMAKKMGFKNFVELGYFRMQRSDYDASMVANYRQQVVEHVVPLVERIRKKQADRIGISPLKFYDLPLFYKSGNPKPKGDSSWIINNGTQMYDELSSETSEFFHFMTNYDLMDLVTKKGKDVGGYCSFIPNYGAPFIFSNFNGTSGDIDVLTHEAGHAFQVYCSRNQKISEYYWPTYESAEIHSMSMEFFTWSWMGLFFKEDTEKYKYEHLSSGLLFLPYGCAVDEFQHLIYENPEMTPDERKDVWKNMQKKYLPHLDYAGLDVAEKGTRWQLQSHIYQSPFYYIDYTLAQVCAYQFWIRLQDNYKEAWKDYLKICKAGGSKSFLELVSLARLKSPFADGVLQNVAESVEAWLNKIDDSDF